MTSKTNYLVSYEYFPISNGGLARHAKEIIDRCLEIDNYNAIIAVPTIQSSLPKKIIQIPCKYFNKGVLGYLEFSIKLYYKFKKLFNKERFIFFSLFSPFLIPRLPKDYSLFIHNTAKTVFETEYFFEPLKDKVTRKIAYSILYNWEKLIAKRAKKIFAVSKSTKEEVINQYGIKKRKVIVIQNGLNLSTFKCSKPKKKFSFNLIFVGRIVPRKNILDLIKIMKLLLLQDSNFKLHIVGKGNQKYLKRIKKEIEIQGVSRGVVYHNFLSDDDLNRIYNSSGLFVFTSLVEGFGLVLLEAMSKGLPVVCYRIPGVQDVVQDGKNGFLIERGDINGFAEKVNFLKENNEIYQFLSRNAIKRIYDFSWERSIKILKEELK